MRKFTTPMESYLRPYIDCFTTEDKVAEGINEMSSLLAWK